MISLPPDLPEGYYLDNVITLFDHVETLYADILDQQHLDFLRDFAALTGDSQKLYIRLLNRSHHLFRLSKLDYPEIGSIQDAIALLNTSGFLQIDPEIDRGELVALFSKAELLALHPEPAGLRKLKRLALDTMLLEQDDDAFFIALATTDCLLQVQQKECYTLCQMLFFGNLNQSMTDFVLRDLGLYQYENYRIDAQSRPYTNSLDIQQHWLLHRLESLLQITESNDIETLQTCFDAVPADTGPDSPLFRKGERIKYEIARQIERLDDLPLALQLYRQCALPPSRERITRILHRQDQIEDAIEHCQSIIAGPGSEEELQFATAFGRRLVRQHKIQDRSVFASPHSSDKPEMFDLELIRQDSVEQAAVDYYLAQDEGNQCHFLENSLFNGVLGLLIWDAVFAPIPGAFYNPFQHRPADFYAQDFQTKRAALLTRVWSGITSTEDIWRQASICWEDKFGRMNPLINWQTLNLETLELALQRIPFNHWMTIFDRILLDLRNNRAGFPDLVLFPATGAYQLVEVKGPGDSLQKNQQRWMQYFSEHEIPHGVARVSWAEQV
jgi:hypothetical protein